MKPRSIEEMWEDFTIATGLTAPGVSPERLAESRHAFFAGLLDMFSALNQVAELTQEEADQTIEGWSAEFTAYATGLVAKAASDHEQTL